jgi:hypothetical protein
MDDIIIARIARQVMSLREDSVDDFIAALKQVIEVLENNVGVEDE